MSQLIYDSLMDMYIRLISCNELSVERLTSGDCELAYFQGNVRGGYTKVTEGLGFQAYDVTKEYEKRIRNENASG